MSRDTNTLLIEVDGREVELDVTSDASIGDIDEDMVQVAPMIAWYGRLLAAARKMADEAEADYRHWKGIAMESVLASDPKLAEWKVRAKVDADPQSIGHKRAIASAWEVANRLDAALTALKVKGEMLRSRGAMMRAEWDTTGMATRSDKVAATKRALKGTD